MPSKRTACDLCGPCLVVRMVVILELQHNLVLRDNCTLAVLAVSSTYLVHTICSFII